MINCKSMKELNIQCRPYFIYYQAYFCIKAYNETKKLEEKNLEK